MSTTVLGPLWEREPGLRVAVLGTGALGCVFAAYLSRVTDVIVVGNWAEGVAAIRTAGIRVRAPDGTERVAKVKATNDPADARGADLALILVKAYQTERAGRWAAALLASDGLAVSLQNGLDNGSKLAAALGADRYAIGVTYLGATLLAAGHVQLVVNEVSQVQAGADREDGVRRMIDLLRAAGLQGETHPDILPALWGKAVANAAINPLTALWRVRNGALLATDERLHIVTTLVDEAASVARRLGVRLPYDDPAGFTAEVCRKTAMNRSSMLQDVESGRRTEIDSINGVIATSAERLGVPAPHNDVVWRLVRGMEPPE